MYLTGQSYRWLMRAPEGYGYAAAQVHKCQSMDSLVRSQYETLFVVVSAIVCITFGVRLSVQVLRSWVHLYKYIPLTGTELIDHLSTFLLHQSSVRCLLLWPDWSTLLHTFEGGF